MTLRSIGGSIIAIPETPPSGITVSATSSIIDAINESLQFIGYACILGGSAVGTKTISAGGGGKIYWNTGATTFANAGTTLRIGIQDVSTTTAPAQGDGTFDVYADLVGATDTIGSSASMATTMEVGTKDIIHGQPISIAFTLQSRAGADSISIRSWVPTHLAGAMQVPATMTNVSGSFARTTGVPDAVIEFDDGTLGWLFGSFTLSLQSNVAYNVNTATADEYGNVVVPPMKGRAVAFFGGIGIASSSSDFELCLYSDPLGSPTLIEAVTVDATTFATSTSFGSFIIPFATEHILNAGTSYGITFRPTSTNNITNYFHDVADARFWNMIMLDNSCYAIRRINNAGAFTDYNGGTAKTRRMWISVLLDQLNDNAGYAQSLIGM